MSMTSPHSREIAGPAITRAECYYCCMSEWGSELREVADSQFGLFTAAQARARGVERYELARATHREVLRRVHHGVYAFVESDHWCTFEDWAAQWLALDPSADIRTRRRRPGAIVSHQTAAAIQNLGSITTNWLTLSGPQRINVRAERTRAYRRPLGRAGVDWHLYEGLPVATPLRIVDDLAREVIDGGHLGTVVEQCLDEDLLTREQLNAVCAPHAHRWHQPAGDGEALVDLLLASAREPLGV